MENIFLIHGYNGIPLIFEYFKNKLEKMGYKVIIPNFPTQQEICVKSFFKVFNENRQYLTNDSIVIAHSIGNAMFLKYISKHQLKIKAYISLAGFAKSFTNKDKPTLNKAVRLSQLTEKQINDCKKFITKRYSIFSDDDHIVPFEILKNFSKKINSKKICIENIGHMGKKSGLKELPEVIDIIKNISEVEKWQKDIVQLS